MALEGRVCELIAEQLGIHSDEIHLDSQLTKDLGADSLDMLELLLALEEEFGIEEISQIEAEKLDTVQKLTQYIESKTM